MRVMVMVKATKSSEAGELPSEQLMVDMNNFNEELMKAGMMLAGEGLKPTSEGYRVRFSGSQREVTDGPFAETKELVAGFWLWEVESIEQAIEWVKRCPNPMMEDSDIEIRPLYELADFADIDSTGELTRQEEAFRTGVATRDSAVPIYLFFSGQCEEALKFYQQAVGASIEMMMRFNESPEPLPEGMLQSGFEDKVMHASFSIGKQTFYASDGCNDPSKFEGFRLTLQVKTPTDAKHVFEALGNGGTVDMPLAPTFFSPCYGQVTDRFGVGWMVMVPGESDGVGA